LAQDELKLEKHSKSAEPKSSGINVGHEDAEWGGILVTLLKQEWDQRF
jgi:hypothetical protein